jgi:hypothetical protein
MTFTKSIALAFEFLIFTRGIPHWEHFSLETTASRIIDFTIYLLLQCATTLALGPTLKLCIVPSARTNASFSRLYKAVDKPSS